MQIKTKIVSCQTADSKPVKQEVDGTVILPPLVFPGYSKKRFCKMCLIPLTSRLKIVQNRLRVINSFFGPVFFRGNRNALAYSKKRSGLPCLWSTSKLLGRIIHFFTKIGFNMKYTSLLMTYILRLLILFKQI